MALNHPGWEAVLDDHSARREATRLGIPCIGTVGLVLTGHRLGIVPSVPDALQTLREAGMYSRMGFSASPWIKPGSEAPRWGLALPQQFVRLVLPEKRERLGVFKGSGVFQPSEFSGSCFRLGPLTSVERSRREMTRCPRLIVPAPKALERCDAYARCDSSRNRPRLREKL